MRKKLDTIQFVAESKIIHNNKYSYDKTIYINAKTKVSITCPKHGEFLQTPNNHLNNKQGCSICGGSIKMDAKQFIKKSKKIHSNKYSYEKVNYLNIKTKVIIICHLHGEFLQTPCKHINNKNGCPKCGNIDILTKEQFIKKSNEIHNNKYFYDKSNYVNNSSTIDIICKKHGQFTQLAKRHLRGQGCPNCCSTKKLTKEVFIQRAIKIHGNKYKYDNVDYINVSKKVNLICLKHGEFNQTPNSHLNGSGCPICNSSKGEIIIENYLKENNINYKTQYSFDDLKYKKLLKFDFNILNNFGDLLFLIEFNGLQHYRYNQFMHRNIDGFKKSKYRDRLKIDYCKNNNIPLFIIKYNEDIIPKLKEIIKRNF